MRNLLSRFIVENLCKNNSPRLATRASRVKEIEEQFECLSFQGLFEVAETENDTVLIPRVPEVAEVEVEVTIVEDADARHPVATVGIFEEPFLLIEGTVPVTFR